MADKSSEIKESVESYLNELYTIPRVHSAAEAIFLSRHPNPQENEENPDGLSPNHWETQPRKENGEFTFRKIQPTYQYNEDAQPSGKYTKILDNMDEATRRSLVRENEAAEIIAKNGYCIEQNPTISGTSRNPDYIIENEVFDCYSPAADTKIRNIASTIEEKVIKKGQTKRIVLNLNDCNCNIDDLIKQLNTYPIEGLEEVIVVKDKTVKSIYP